MAGAGSTAAQLRAKFGRAICGRTSATPKMPRAPAQRRPVAPHAIARPASRLTPPTVARPARTASMRAAKVGPAQAALKARSTPRTRPRRPCVTNAQPGNSRMISLTARPVWLAPLARPRYHPRLGRARRAPVASSRHPPGKVTLLGRLASRARQGRPALAAPALNALLGSHLTTTGLAITARRAKQASARMELQTRGIATTA